QEAEPIDPAKIAATFGGQCIRVPRGKLADCLTQAELHADALASRQDNLTWAGEMVGLLEFGLILDTSRAYPLQLKYVLAEALSSFEWSCEDTFAIALTILGRVADQAATGQTNQAEPRSGRVTNLPPLSQLKERYAAMLATRGGRHV
ncbi:hypothetical protein, partial [Pseudodesulfovibrio pelocollis]|uniref:hypothetical protein n=1 Tax=Pseudodesulfovibrio pelocollis TaxID=3051432 RepID=UPI00255AE3B8